VMTAGQDLRGMVQSDLVEQSGFGRWTKYILKLHEEKAEEPKIPSNEEKILAHVEKLGSINNTECRDLLEIDLNKASYLLKKLAKKGILKQSGKRRWTRYRLS
jgi:predicted HTH transcriptional regulator